MADTLRARGGLVGGPIFNPRRLNAFGCKSGDWQTDLGAFLGGRCVHAQQGSARMTLGGESLDKRGALAVFLLLAGGVVLVIEQGALGQIQLWGLLAVIFATVAWGVDNTLSRGVAERDPGRVVLVKAVLGSVCTLALATLFDEPIPLVTTAMGLVAVGATGYGLSLRFYLLAQRTFGAARTGSVFAFAPFIGAIGALALGDRSGSGLMFMAGALMMLGVLLHLMEAHAHEHTHDPLEHEHSHRHDDGHHGHVHDLMPTVPHNHRHKHEPVTHSHAHVPDAHHEHSH